MKSPAISTLDVVALLVDVPEHDLVRGQVGTVVEELDDDSFEVEFSDGEGRTYGLAAVPGASLLLLHYGPNRAA